MTMLDDFDTQIQCEEYWYADYSYIRVDDYEDIPTDDIIDDEDDFLDDTGENDVVWDGSQIQDLWESRNPNALCGFRRALGESVPPPRSPKKYFLWDFQCGPIWARPNLDPGRLIGTQADWDPSQVGLKHIWDPRPIGTQSIWDPAPLGTQAHVGHRWTQGPRAGARAAGANGRVPRPKFSVVQRNPGQT